MFRKDALIKIGLYDERMRLCEEQDLRLRLQMAGYHVGHVEVPLYRYTLHSDNITSELDRLSMYEETLRRKYQAMRGESSGSES
jgi:GT2 family glycosyltransferase